ncbi:uncharacterized protein LOC118279863 [Spodoptera frugiperda]|uniref:Uncharacterized protein LOC118279863 n=1 Tax=Spodoptera frugiperda TaxID=7108 RepID=A0A9R0DIU2_SPOFR|nr:uncharacterized protein LOC118279863 [Spodoptera frugiperda]
MKVLVITLLCAIASCAAGGSVAWPGAIAVSSPLLKTIIPGETKTTAYSTTQYINAVPTSYAFAAQPQFAYHGVPQVNSFASLQPAYYPIAAHSYIPTTNVFYPSAASFAPVQALAPGFPAAPAFPSAPAYPSAPESSPAPAYPGSSPSPPSSPSGDADSAVVDSADYNAEQQRQQEPASTPAPQPPAPEPTQPAPQFPPFPPSNTFPNFPSFPQLPQEPGQAPSFPQLPQQPIAQYPDNIFLQGTSSPPSSFPGANNEDKGLNDADTVSVESA